MSFLNTLASPVVSLCLNFKVFNEPYDSAGYIIVNVERLRKPMQLVTDYYESN
ncbi:hypothetical protein [Legionella sp. PC997]|uniref:hypothetical protein n=1 Tax=Legionella sp. PC997 TaxID=2755562 RepID=UPI0015FA16C0|nr:hypothetical protein [Legionella sp. PC997]